MNIFAFLFIAGLSLKGLFILIESSIDRLSLKYDTMIISIPIDTEHEDFTPEEKMEIRMEIGSNSVKPLGKKIICVQLVSELV